MAELFFEYESYLGQNDSIYNAEGVRIKRFKFVSDSDDRYEYGSDDTRTCWLRNTTDIVPSTLSIENPVPNSGSVAYELSPVVGAPSDSLCYYVRKPDEENPYVKNPVVYYLCYKDSEPRSDGEYEYGTWGYPGLYLIFKENDEGKMCLTVCKLRRSALLGSGGEFDPIPSDSVISQVTGTVFTQPVYDPSQKEQYFGYVLKAIPNTSFDSAQLNTAIKNNLESTRPTNGVFASSFDVLAKEVGRNYEALWGTDLSKRYWFEFTASALKAQNFKVCDSFYVSDGNFEYDYKLQYSGLYDASSDNDPKIGYYAYKKNYPSSLRYAGYPQPAFSLSDNGTVFGSNKEEDLFINGPKTYSYDANGGSSSIQGQTEYTVTLKNGVYWLFVRLDSNLYSYTNDFISNQFAIKLFKIIVDSSDSSAPVKIKVYRPRSFCEKVPYTANHQGSGAFRRTLFGSHFSKFLDSNNKVLDDTYSNGDSSLLGVEWICERTLYMLSAQATLHIDDSRGLDTEYQWDIANRILSFGGEAFLYDVSEVQNYNIHLDNVPISAHRYYGVYDGEPHTYSLKVEDDGVYAAANSSYLKWLRIPLGSTDISELDAYLYDYLFESDRVVRCLSENVDTHVDLLYATSTLAVTDSNVGDYYDSSNLYDVVIAVYNNDLVDYASVAIDRARLAFNTSSGITIDSKTYDGTADVYLSQTVLESDEISNLMSESIYNNTTIPAIKVTAYFPSIHVGTQSVPLHFSWNSSASQDSNYYPPDDEYVSGTIEPRQLSIRPNQPSTATKEYDGTRNSNHITVVPGGILNVVAADVDYIGLTATVPPTNPTNVGNTVFPSPNIYELGTVYVEYSVTSSDPTLLTDYLPPSGHTLNAMIVQRQLEISGTSSSKEYDGFTAVSILPGNLTNVVGDDSISVSVNPEYTYATSSPNIGSYKVLVHYKISGVGSAKYKAPVDEYIDATITPKPLTISGTQVVKDYDATTSVSDSNIIMGEVTGFVGSESFTLVPHVEDEFPSSSVSDDYVLGVSYTASDSNNYSSNYSWPEIHSVQGIINPIQLTVSGTNADKYYDGYRNVIPTVAQENVRGVIGNDVVIVSATSSDLFPFAVGSYNVEVAYSLSGAQAGNYLAPTRETITATLQPSTITCTIVETDNDEESKVYDGSPDVSDCFHSFNVHYEELNKDTTVTRSSEPYFVEYESGNPTGQVFWIESYLLNTNNEKSKNTGNYRQIGSTATKAGHITQDQSITEDADDNYIKSEAVSSILFGVDRASITVSNITANKEWDSTSRGHAVFDVAGIVDGDDAVVVASVSDFNSPEIGTTATLSASFSVEGIDARNYKIISPVGAVNVNGSITKRTVSIVSSGIIYS